MRRSLLSIAVVICSLISVAQTDSPGTENPEAEEKQVDHFVSFQANPLLRQILSLSTVPSVESPYLLNYTLRFNGSNLTISSGFGFSSSNTENEDNLVTRSSDLDLRLGVGQQFRLNKLLEIGYSLDLNFGNRDVSSKTITVNESPFQTDSTVTETKTSEEMLGAALRANLLFYITPRILVGTEASYSFSQIDSSFDFKRVTTIRQNGEVTLEDTAEDESSETTEAFDFNIPVQIFFILKF
ncbi:hypothetical protein [Halocola ammonii]